MDKQGGGDKIEEQYNVRHILIKPDEIRSEEDAGVLINDLYQRINRGEPFDVLAKRYSDDTGSALNGGKLGWNNVGDLIPAFAAVMKNTPINTVSEPFHTSYGWHILEVLGTREEDMSQQYRRNQARNILRNRHFIEELELWLDEIREEAFVEIKADMQ
jgi:peptidyl-prolyl cis-trans isomerase SurA